MSDNGLAFSLQIDCPRCGGVFHYGLNVTLLTYCGQPVIPIDMATQFGVECTDCGANIYVGELPVFAGEDGGL